jgi:hypothetical protein
MVGVFYFIPVATHGHFASKMIIIHE